MSILDKLRQAWDDSKDEAKDKAATAAARQAAAAAKAAVAAVGEEFLGDAEGMLDQARKDREGRPDARPDASKADDIEGYIKELATEAETTRKTRAQREADAKAELARLKAGMKPPDAAEE